ncbi:MAG: outer membrane lipoprotein-sorting protein [Alphaproteobacteria bacterium GM202ARS2]|nr:outer membrane lipoprotein-sorting protein [Alphaproteobacteria bacterium GM202ARS2]
MSKQNWTTESRGMGLVFLWCVVLVGAMVPTQGLAQGDGEPIMQAVYDQGRLHKNQQADVELVIKDAEGRERTRFFTLRHKIFPERSKTLVKFYEPASVRGTALLSETLDKETHPSQWIYLPAFRSIKRLSSEEQNKSFVGSDFTNGDVAGRKVERDKHVIKEKNDKVAIIESTPTKSDDDYTKLEVHVLLSVMVPARIVFYGKGGEKLKTLHNRNIRKIDGMYTVVEAVMENHQSGGTSIITKTDIDFTSEIDEKLVGFKGLQM